MLKENSSYADQPKAAPLGAGRISPIRSQGESELRLNSANAVFDGSIVSHHSLNQRLNPDRLAELGISANQLEQVMRPRGYATDISSDLFAQPMEVLAPKAFIPDDGQDTELQEMFPFLHMKDIEELSANKSMLYGKDSLQLAEYLNRKMQLQPWEMPDYTVPSEPEPVEEPRKIQKFIFEPGTVMSKPLDKIRVDLFMPYTECLFVVPMEDFVLDGLTIPGSSYEVIGLELSKTKFFFWLTFQEVELCVQVNMFDSKKKSGEFEYRAWMADGPNSTLESKDPRTRYLKPALTLIEPIFAFLEGLSKRKYSLLSKGVVVQGAHVPPPAAEGDVFTVLKYTTDKAYQKRVYKGGTHARPREHERIAHKRTLRNGEVRLFPQVTVNKGIGGRVIKDYLIIDPEVPDEIPTSDS